LHDGENKREIERVSQHMPLFVNLIQLQELPLAFSLLKKRRTEAPETNKDSRCNIRLIV
jgi:hypothetical protein